MSKLLGEVLIDTARVALMRKTSQSLWTVTGSGKPLYLAIWGRDADKAMKLVSEAFQLTYQSSRHHQLLAPINQLDPEILDAFLEGIRDDNCWFIWSVIKDNSYDRCGLKEESNFQIDLNELDVVYIVSTRGSDGKYPVYQLNDGGIMIWFGSLLDVSGMTSEVLDTFTLEKKTDWLAADPCYVREAQFGVPFSLKPGSYRVEQMLINQESRGIRIVKAKG